MAKIGDLCAALQYGYTASALTEPRGPRFLRITDIQNGAVAWGSVPHCEIKKDQIAKYLLRPGDILFARTGGTVGKSYLITAVPEPSVFASYLIRLAPHRAVFPKFLYYFFQSGSYWEQVGLKKGGLQGNINATTLATLEMPLCSNAEQRRIVAKIDELFSELESGVKTLIIAREQLKIYWESLLTHAFRAVVDFRALPKLLARPMSNGYSGKPVQGPTLWRVLSLSATTSGVFSPLHFKYLDEPGLEARDIWCEPNDILVQRGNTKEYVGVPAIYTGAPREFVFPDLMIRLRANRELISPTYLWYALSTPRIRNEMRRRAKGSAGTMPKINHKILSELHIPYCSPTEQQHVVEELEALKSHVNVLEADISAQLSRLDVLRAAILRQAFSGKLVQQNANDETASALLEEIRAEQEEAVVKKERAAKTKKTGAA